MRRVTFALNISIDGYCDHTSFSPSEDLMDYFTNLMHNVDLLFYGRIMYQLMFPYWADVANNQTGTPDEIRFAERLTAIDKVVVSTTLKTADHNIHIIRSNPVDELLRLKQLPGKEISVDSVSMLPEFIKAGLIDEFNLVVHPVIVGRGRPFLSAGSLIDNQYLKLAETINFKSGCVAFRYLKP